MRLNSIQLLKPFFRVKVEAMLKILDDKGFKYKVYETLRPQAIQDAYYAQGRESLARVNDLRKAADLAPIVESENKVITQVRRSKHTLGIAMDVVPLTPEGKLWWNAPSDVWKVIADAALAVELEAGHYWNDFKDSPHVELP